MHDLLSEAERPHRQSGRGRKGYKSRDATESTHTRTAMASNVSLNVSPNGDQTAHGPRASRSVSPRSLFVFRTQQPSGR